MLTYSDRPSVGPPLQPDALAPFTPRECEVLALLIAGPSNRQIATTLSISERTVESHVANILGKLGLTNRTQVIGWAAAQGLLLDLIDAGGPFVSAPALALTAP